MSVFIADQPNNPFQMAGYYAYLPARLAGTKLNYAVIKNSLYADPLVLYLPELIERQKHNLSSRRSGHEPLSLAMTVPKQLPMLPSNLTCVITGKSIC